MDCRNKSILKLGFLSFCFYGISAFNVYSEISDNIVSVFQLHCLTVIGRPKSVQPETALKKWFKKKKRWMMNTKPEDGSGPVDYDHFRCLNIVLSDVTKPDKFSMLTHKIDLHRAFWLAFVNHQSMENFFATAKLPFSLEMLAANVVNVTHAEIYDVYQANHSQPIRFKFLGNWTQTRGLIMTGDKFIYKRRSNLEGISLRIGLIENWPFSFQVGDNNWMGFFPTIWKQIEEFTNMTSQKIKNQSTGSRRNNKWSGLIGMSVDGKIDAIVSELTLDVNRIRVLDFSQPLLKARYQIFYKQPGFVLDWGAVFRPFPLPLWKAILVWIILSSLSFSFCNFCLRQFKIEPTTSGLISCVFFALQSLSQQGRDNVPRSIACRILFFSSYLVSAVVIPAYSASLISSLTRKTPFRPFDSIGEMLQDGTFKLLVHHDTAEFDYFANSNDPELLAVYVNHILTVPTQYTMTSTANSTKIICQQSNFALFGVDAILSRKIFRPPGPSCNIISMTKHLRTIHLGLALPKKHPLHPLVKYHLGLMIERGILSRIEAATWPILPVQPRAVTSWNEVRLEDVFQIFVLLAAGIVLSLILLIFECFLFPPKPMTLPHYTEYFN